MNQINIREYLSDINEDEEFEIKKKKKLSKKEN